MANIKRHLDNTLGGSTFPEGPEVAKLGKDHLAGPLDIR
jgi:hypothetical protein